MSDSESSIRMIGYQVRALEAGAVVGEVEGVCEQGLAIHRIPGHSARHGYLPAEAIMLVSHQRGTIVLVDGIDAASILDAPPPPTRAGRRRRLRGEEWWATLRDHYGLSECRAAADESSLQGVGG